MRGAALEDADIDRFPDIIAGPDAVLLDREEKTPTLIHVFSSVVAADKTGKIAVRLNFAQRRRGTTTVSNAFRTAGYVRKSNLRERRYDALEGSVE